MNQVIPSTSNSRPKAMTFDLMPTSNSGQAGVASQMKQILHSDFVVSISDSHVLLMTTDLPRNKYVPSTSNSRLKVMPIVLITISHSR
jgi:hypothetical protein